LVGVNLFTNRFLLCSDEWFGECGEFHTSVVKRDNSKLALNLIHDNLCGDGSYQHSILIREILLHEVKVENDILKGHIEELDTKEGHCVEASLIFDNPASDNAYTAFRLNDLRELRVFSTKWYV
jgi:hypothetical protein